MANLKEIRSRITSVGSTMKITSAMKMVSASKLKKAQDAITQMRPYADKLTELLQNLSATLEEETGSIYSEQRDINKVLLIVVSSDRGLCGGFNSNVVKETHRHIEANYSGKHVEILTLGKKGYESLKKTNDIWQNKKDVLDNLKFEDVATIAEEIMAIYQKGDFDRIDIIYNHFKNAATQIPTVEQFLPIKPITDGEAIVGDYIFEPSKETIIEVLIPKALKIQLFAALRDSFAAEHGARMTAMHKATDNAKDLKDELTLNYNKARQSAITSEILEIVGGAEALNS